MFRSARNAILAAAIGVAGFTLGGEHTFHVDQYVSTAGTVTITSSAWLKVGGGAIVWSVSDADGWTHTSEALVADAGTGTGSYEILWSVSFSGSNLKNYEFTVATDDNADPTDGTPTFHTQCKQDRDLTAVATGNVGGVCRVPVVDGDYVYLVVMQTNAGDNDIAVSHASLMAHQM